MKSDLKRFKRAAMHTEFEVQIMGEDATYARQAADAVFREVERINNLLNRYDAGSDIGQLNLLGAGEVVGVGIETIECLEQAQWVYRMSEGLFDPSLGKGFEQLVVDRNSFRVGWKESGSAALDLGGIAKGFAIDKATDVLADWEVSRALIHGGTSTVMALGCAWEVGVGGLWGVEAGLSVISLYNRSLSGSGTDVQGDHILNPRSGKPAQNRAAWALHRSAAVSDALATAFMVMPMSKIAAFCERNKGVGAFIVDQNESFKQFGV
ncbi:MAG: hypothetical protein CBE26_02180 [Kiritimatiellaceae bacterium TMED266]|nr:MAG: hypothetical protein CBE26_02180 [Kiritimatiellaceae bacterium TMED266]